MKKPQPPGLVLPQQRWAVLVGVSQYLHLPESAWLESCDKDAQALAQFLLSPRGGSFPPEQVKVLVNQAATTQAIRLSMDQLIKRVRPGDVVYLFFACHGRVEVSGSGEVAYLLPYDTEESSLNATALPMDEIRRYVDVSLRHCSQVVVISDACHAGGLGASEPVSVNSWLQGIGERSGVLNIMACRRDEKAVEDPSLGHGLLTYCLLRVLSGEGSSSSEGLVRAQDVLEYLMRNVPRLSQQKQHPRHSSNYLDEFVMAQLRLPGPRLHLPRPPADATDNSRARATLQVHGAAVNSEVYLVQGRFQQTVGRVLSRGNTLILQGVAPGSYVLVQSLQDQRVERGLEIRPGLNSVDLSRSP